MGCMSGMNETDGGLRSRLKLEPCGENAWRSVTADTNYGGEVFGGQYLGLSVGAAMRSAPGRTPHAMTSYFLRSAVASRPVEYHVEQTRDGKAFAHRRVTAIQDGKEVFRAEVSFHEWEDNEPAHAARMPDVPSAETLPTLRESVLARAGELGPVTVRRIVNRHTFDTHFVDAEEGLGKAGSRPETVAWVVPRPAPDPSDAVAYYSTLAYLTDACANFASRTLHSANLYDGQLLSVSMNHATWFHAPPCPIEKLLYVVDSPFAGGGLGYNRGTMFDAGGRVLASIVQEALIRRNVAMEG